MRTVLVFGNQGSLQYIFLRDTVHVPNVKNMTKAIFNSPITELTQVSVPSLDTILIFTICFPKPQFNNVKPAPR